MKQPDNIPQLGFFELAKVFAYAREYPASGVVSTHSFYAECQFFVALTKLYPEQGKLLFTQKELYGHVYGDRQLLEARVLPEWREEYHNQLKTLL